MLSAIFKDGELERIYYFESPKNDGYPIVQLSEDEKMLKGFNWQPQKRPADRNAVTPLSLRPSQRNSYSARPKATFRQTDIYFPGYMNDIYRQIEVRDSLRAVRERERQFAEAQAAERARLDSLALADSLAQQPALDEKVSASDSLAVADSLATTDSLAVSDSLAVVDSLATLSPKELAAAERARIKAEKKAAKEAAKKKKQEEREARWAELDKRDAEKAAAKEAKRLDKERKRKIKALEDAARQAEKDAAVLEKYRQKFEKKKAREDARRSK